MKKKSAIGKTDICTIGQSLKETSDFRHRSPTSFDMVVEIVK